jgi:CheY-like chemotaxis protein
MTANSTIKKPLTEFNAMPRILIVDNDARTRRAYQELLKHWEYQPILADGDAKLLLEDAQAKARNHRCQLALMDMRLIDDFDDDDKSGLELIPKLKPASCIMVSARANLADAREGEEKGAAGFVGKGEGPKALQEKLEREAQKICAQKKGLSIEPVEILGRLASTLLGNHIPRQYHDQIADAFLRLFPDAQLLRVEKVGTSHISSDLLTVPRPRSVILKVYEDDRQPVIVKLARVHKVKRELRNFREYIEGRLFGNFVPVLRRECVLWDIGGLKLSYVGTIDQTFSNFFRTNRVGRIRQSLTNFFKNTWSPYYEQPTEARNVSLFDLYCQVWEMDWVERIQRFQDFHPEDVMGRERWEQAQAPNPIEWVKENILNGRDASIVEYTKTAITHGDLHGDNILVDTNNNIWVVDFERTGPGHILQDFIELESDIINRLPCTAENFPAFLSICIAACEQNEIKGMELTESVEAQTEMKKAMLTISHLRSLARECTGLSDARQYLLGLLFNTLFRATISTSNQRKNSQQRALMLAGIICHRLEHWGEPWPPTQWLHFLYERGNYGK